jgi:hypothetical protein
MRDGLKRLHVDSRYLALVLDIDEHLASAVRSRKFQDAANRDGCHHLLRHGIDHRCVAAIVVHDKHELGKRVIGGTIRTLCGGQFPDRLIGLAVDDANRASASRQHQQVGAGIRYRHVTGARAQKLADVARLCIDRRRVIGPRHQHVPAGTVEHSLVKATITYFDTVNDLVGWRGRVARAAKATLRNRPATEMPLMNVSSLNLIRKLAAIGTLKPQPL